MNILKCNIYSISPLPFCLFCILGFVLSCCISKKQEKEIAVYNTHCAGCHMAPKIEELPKAIWENKVLPAMFARMEVEDLRQDKYQGPFKSETTGFRPKISLNEMVLLEEYILNNAPDELEANPIPDFENLKSFEQSAIALDNEDGSQVTYLAFNSDDSKIIYGTATGALSSYDFKNRQINKKFQADTPVTWFSQRSKIGYVTEVGLFDPSDEQRGAISSIGDEGIQVICDSLHRPVHTLVEDLNNDGKDEVVICEFGDEAGKVSMLVQNDSGAFEKTILLNLPGSIRTIARDMNNDDKLDLIVLTSQAWEGVSILYQYEALQFSAENVMRFSPVYGSSWFELVDYNNDSFIDIITINGDNADKSYVQKPYHGMRIHLNDGNNNFEEVYFYPLNGATRVVSDDFDEDGDLDFAVLSSFPDYEKAPQMSFVYLENVNSGNFEFKTNILSEPNAGRWFLMDKGDIDQDGDTDIIVSALTYTFSPTPEEISKQWSTSKIDLLILKNKLK